MNNKTDITPFWLRLKPIASYPFRGAAMWSTLVLAAFIFVGDLLPVAGRILAVVGWVAAFKYAFEVLQSTAHGRVEAPEVVMGMDNSVVWRYIALQLLAVLIPIIVGVAVGIGWGIGLYVLLALVQPAAIMTLAMTQSLRAAIDPSLWGQIIGRIGWPYLALIGLMIVMQASAANASSLLDSFLPWLIALAAGVLFSLWSLFATFHLMGYMLWQYHESLGFEPKSLSQPAGLPYNRDRELLDAASSKVQDGHPAAAIELIRTELRSRALSIEVHELYRRLLQQAGDHAALAEHGPLFLHLLLMEKQERRALGLARECLDANRDFVALQVEDSAKLAERAAFGGQSKLAVDLLLAAIRRHPGDPAMPQWTLRAVDLMLRQPGGETQARSLIEHARKRCQDAELDQKLAAQLAALPA